MGRVIATTSNPKRKYTYYYNDQEFESSPDLAKYLRETEDIEVWPTQINLMFSGHPPVALRPLIGKITRKLQRHMTCDVCGKYIYEGQRIVTDANHKWCCCSVDCLASKLMLHDDLICSEDAVSNVLNRQWQD